MVVSPSSVPAGSAGNTFGFTFSAPVGKTFAAASYATVVVPAGWTAPQTTNSANPGFVNTTAGTCAPGAASVTGTGPWTITVVQACAAGTSFTINYGAGSSVAKVTAPSTAGTATFTSGSHVGSGGAATTLTSGSPQVSVTAGVATQLVFTTQPSPSTVAGAAFGAQPVVAVRDSLGNTITTDTSSVTLSLTGGTAGAVLSCTVNPKPAVAGVATFAGCAVDRPGTLYQLSATDGSLTAATSNTFTVTAAVAASGDGAMVVSPSSVPAGSAGNTFGFTFSAPVGKTFAAASYATVVVPAGWTAPQTTNSANPGFVNTTAGTCAPGAASVTGTGPWTITVVQACAAGTSFTINYGAGSSVAKVTAPSTAGTATFTSGSHAGSGGAATTLTSGSPQVSVTAGVATQLVFTTQPSPSTVAGAAFGAQPVVAVRDSLGNTITTDTSSVTLSLTGGTAGAVLSCTVNPKPAVAGVATFAGCAVDRPGTLYQLSATDGSLTAATSNTFTVTAAVAASGDGAMVVSPSSVPAGSAGNTFGFTFSAPVGKTFAAASYATVVVPAGWTAPQTTNSANPGFVNTTAGTCAPGAASVTGTGPWTITVVQACAAGTSFTINYGAGSSVAKVTAPSTAGTATFTSGSHAGSGGAATTLTSGSPQVTVTPASQTITFAALSNRAYGTAAFTVSATATSGLQVSFSVATPTSCSSSGVNGATITLLAAGTCTVQADQAGNANISPAPSVQQSFTITKAHLTVTANNQSRVYGAGDPAFDATISGFVNSETLGTSGVTGSASCSTTASASSSVAGSPYAITCTQGTLAAGNYDFTPFVAGQLTVTKAALTVTADNKSRAYGAANPALTSQITGFVNGRDVRRADVPADVFDDGDGVELGGRFAVCDHLLGCRGRELLVHLRRRVVDGDDGGLDRHRGTTRPRRTARRTRRSRTRSTGFENGETGAVVTGTPVCSTTATAVDGGRFAVSDHL